jgi:hypothetical protein
MRRWQKRGRVKLETISHSQQLAALYIALGGLPAHMRVRVDKGIKVPAKIVAELRKVTAWPENLAITTPHHRNADNFIRISKANVVTRTAPKS